MWLGFINKADESFTYGWKAPLCTLQRQEDEYAWNDPECTKVPMTFDADFENELCLVDKVMLTGFWSSPVCLNDEIELTCFWSNLSCLKTDIEYSAEFENTVCVVDKTEFGSFWSDRVCLKEEGEAGLNPEEPGNPNPDPEMATLFGTFTVQNNSDYDVTLFFPIKDSGMNYRENRFVAQGSSVNITIDNGNVVPPQQWSVLMNSVNTRFQNSGNFGVSNASLSPIPSDSLTITPDSYSGTQCQISGTLIISNSAIQ